MRLQVPTLGLCILTLLLASCRPDAAFPPPPQATPKPYFARTMLDMAAGQPQPAGAAIQSGVEPETPNLNWRWLSTPALFTFSLEDRPNWQLELHLTVVDKVQEKTGPQRLTVLLNGQELTRTTLSKPGPLNLTLPANPGLKPTVELRVEPCLPQPYSQPYCTLIHSLGFSRPLTGDFTGELK